MLDVTSLTEAEDDAALASRLLSRDPLALAELYDRYGRIAYLIIHRITGNGSAAEDLVQETFLRVWNSMPAFDRARGSLRRWVLSVARNGAIDYLRSWEGRMSRGAVPVQDWQQPQTSPDFEKDVLNLDTIRALRSALNRLTPRQREILDMAYEQELTQTEIAALLKKPLGTVKTWVRTALQVLRLEMAPYRQEQA